MARPRDGKPLSESMPRIRVVEIEHYRCIQRLRWTPNAGFNALIGPGDGGKSTVLDAIDQCLTARRSLSFTDADFYALDVTTPIQISVTVGELPPTLLDFDAYGSFVRGFAPETGELVDEMGVGYETAKTFLRRVRAKYAAVERPAGKRSELIVRAEEDGIL